MNHKPLFFLNDNLGGNRNSKFSMSHDQLECVRTNFFSSSFIKMGTYRVQHILTTSLIQKSLVHTQPDIFWKRRVFTPFTTKNMRSHVAYSKRWSRKRLIDWLIDRCSNCFLWTIFYEWHTKGKIPERSKVNSMNSLQNSRMYILLQKKHLSLAGASAEMSNSKMSKCAM